MPERQEFNIHQEYYCEPCKLYKDDTHSSLFSWQYSQSILVHSWLSAPKHRSSGRLHVGCYIPSTITSLKLCGNRRGFAAFPARRLWGNLHGIYMEKPRSNVRHYLRCYSRAGAVLNEIISTSWRPTRDGCAREKRLVFLCSHTKWNTLFYNTLIYFK